MAIALPILISIFGVSQDALLPVLGFLIGIMKGATIGGAVPAILFNTPGTPDAVTTTYDGHPMAQRGQAKKALRIAHLSSVSGDTFSDVVLIFTAPFLAIMVERYLDLPEKTALICSLASSPRWWAAISEGTDAAASACWPRRSPPAMNSTSPDPAVAATGRRLSGRHRDPRGADPWRSLQVDGRLDPRRGRRRADPSKADRASGDQRPRGEDLWIWRPWAFLP